MHILGFLLLLLIIWLIYKRKGTFRQKYTCTEGRFRIAGKKKCFKINKDGRFEFVVVDGKIVSFRDRAASNTTIRYGGGEDGLV